MTKILYVSGEDFATSTFELLVGGGKITARELWLDNVYDYKVGVYDKDDYYFEYEAMEFGEVDPDFIEWIKSIQDYDASKTAQFYVIEEEA